MEFPWHLLGAAVAVALAIAFFHFVVIGRR